MIRINDNRLKEVSSRIVEETYPDSDGYKGWFETYRFKFGKESDEYFNFDFSKEKDIVALIFLATIWNMPNYRWENAVGFIGTLYKNNLLDIEKWKSQSFVESLNQNKLVREMNNFDSSDLYGRGDLYIKNGKDGVFQRLHIVAKEYNFLKDALYIDEILNGDVPKIDYSIFPKFENSRLKIEVKGRNNRIVKKPLLRVKIPLILRELKCYNKIEISGAYCCVPDTRVKQMLKTIGYNPRAGYDIDSVIQNSKIIHKYFGPYYDLPLFDFSEKCSKAKNKECNQTNCPIFEYCAKL